MSLSVLVVVDNSRASLAAVRRGADLALEDRARLTIVCRRRIRISAALVASSLTCSVAVRLDPDQTAAEQLSAAVAMVPPSIPVVTQVVPDIGLRRLLREMAWVHGCDRVILGLRRWPWSPNGPADVDLEFSRGFRRTAGAAPTSEPIAV